MRKDKLLSLSLAILLLIVGTVSALTVSSVQPTDGGYLQGNSSELFNVTFTTALVTDDCFFWLWNSTAYESTLVSGVAGKKSCATNIDVSNTGKFPEGSNTLRWYVVADGENHPTAGTNYTATIDRTLPIVTITATHAGIPDQTVDFNGTCTDTYLSSCVVKYDNGVSNTTLATLNGTTAPLADGTYKFWTIAQDLAGNRKDIASAPLTIDAPPAAPTGLTITSLTETSLFLDWIDNVEPDLSTYTVYGNLGSGGIDVNNPATYDVAFNVTPSNFTHTGLTTGDTWYYVITVWDATTQSNASTEVSGVVEDMTPPMPPVVTATSGPCSGESKTCNISASSELFTIDYSGTESANLNLSIWSGLTLVDQFFDNITFNWPFNFSANGTYLFTFNATDAFGNYNETTYLMNVGNGSVNLTIVDIIRLNFVRSVAKATARGTGGDYFLLRYDFDMYGGDFVRARMTDMVSPTDLIRINEDSAPLFFCGADYDSVRRDIVPSPVYNTYNVDNDYDGSQSALDCPDTDPSGGVKYTAYLKIPIPAGTDSGSYNLNVGFALYTTEI